MHKVLKIRIIVVSTAIIIYKYEGVQRVGVIYGLDYSILV